jgi:hypothetical protein
MLLGNTLGGFDPARIATDLASMMRSCDLAIVDGELFAGPDTLAGYDNPINRRFAFAPLAGAGLTADDGALEFTLASDERRAGLHRVEKRFTAARHARLSVAGESLWLRAGDVVRMSASHKYDEQGYRSLLADAGLETLETYRSADGRFLMSLVRRG